MYKKDFQKKFIPLSAINTAEYPYPRTSPLCCWRLEGSPIT